MWREKKKSTAYVLTIQNGAPFGKGEIAHKSYHATKSGAQKTFGFVLPKLAYLLPYSSFILARIRGPSGGIYEYDWTNHGWIRENLCDAPHKHYLTK